MCKLYGTKYNYVLTGSNNNITQVTKFGRATIVSPSLLPVQNDKNLIVIIKF